MSGKRLKMFIKQLHYIAFMQSANWPFSTRDYPLPALLSLRSKEMRFIKPNFLKRITIKLKWDYFSEGLCCHFSCSVLCSTSAIWIIFVSWSPSVLATEQESRDKAENFYLFRGLEDPFVLELQTNVRIDLLWTFDSPKSNQKATSTAPNTEKG